MRQDQPELELNMKVAPNGYTQGCLHVHDQQMCQVRRLWNLAFSFLDSFGLSTFYNILDT